MENYEIGGSEEERNLGDAGAEPSAESAETAAYAPKVISRRSFLAGTAALAATMALATGCTTSDDGDEEEGSAEVESDEDAEEEEELDEESSENDEFPVTVTDLSGYEVTIEEQPQSIGALLGNSYEHIFFLGAADRVSCRMEMSTDAWIKVIDPDFENYDTVEFASSSARDPNVEELAELGVDVVYYWADLAEQKANMEEIGITVVESNPTAVEFTTVEEWRQLLRDEMNLYADTLGGDCTSRANEWCDYADDIIDMALERTENLSDEDRPGVYCIRNQEDGLECFAKSSYISMIVEVAGGTLVTKDIDTDLSGFTTVTIEDVAEWNPDVIFMGWLDDPALITDNEQWSSFNAVANDEVYLLPCSLNSTDWQYYCELPLEILYVAKILQPDLFDDIDVIAEIQNYYATFFDCELTEDQCQAMLDRQDPSGESNDNF